MFKKFLIVVLSAACVMALASCGTGASAETQVETVPEKAAAREVLTRTEWSLDDIASLSDVVTGITDREYVAGEGSARGIREDMTFDREFIHTVLLNTASVRFDTPGEYPMTYWVYFGAAALADRTDAADMGFDIPGADRLAVAVHATVTVTEAEEDEDAEDAEDAGDGAAGAVTASSGGGPGSSSESTGSTSKSSGSGSGSTSKSSGSGSGSSSGSGSGSQAAGCSHVWVEVTEEVAVREGRYVCNNCGYATLDGTDIGDHTMFVCGGCGYSAKSVVVGTQTVGTGTYVCSKCGATK